MNLRAASGRAAASYAAVLGLASTALGWTLACGWYPASILLLPLVVWALVRLVGLFRDVVGRVHFMFSAVENDDYAFRFCESSRRVDDRLLNASLNRIREILALAKRRAEERERYYQLIMEHAGTGLLTLDEGGNVYQANGEALRLFGLSRLTHVRQIRIPAAEAYEALRDIRPGGRRRVACRDEMGETVLTMSCAGVCLENKRLRIVALTDIDNEISATQVETWSRLTRILTHEIMNSLAPVTSLSDTLLRLDAPLDADVAEGLRTIGATGRRLMAFVENFRRFTRIPEPRKEPFEVRAWIDRIVALAVPASIRTVVSVEPADMLVYADPRLAEQVAVNLLKNACEAVGSRPDACIEICARIDARENVLVEISNNGGAIPPETAENIFTPFFTTKTDGSGIGLSVSRRIMQLHEGALRLAVNTPERVTFTMLFR